MAKLTAWLVTVIGVLLLLPLIGVDLDALIFNGLNSWLIAIGVLAIGIGKLMRNYNKKRK
jgi:membrane protein required for beta-lactamase induction